MKNKNQLTCIAVAALALFGSDLKASAQDWAKAKLEKSPRHLEWVEVKQGDRTLKCFIAYPAAKKPTASIVVIHEIFGLSDWVRKVCDDLAAAGFVAIAPDLLSGKPGEDTTKFTSVDDVRKAVSGLPRDQVASDLKAVADYVSKLPATNGKTAVTGFCWGGTQTWLAVTTNSSFKIGFVYYGTAGASTQDFSRIEAPVYGFYGEEDARVTSTINDTKAKMKEANKKFYPAIYSKAGHGFMRTAQSPEATQPDIDAQQKSWKQMIDVMKKL